MNVYEQELQDTLEAESLRHRHRLRGPQCSARVKPQALRIRSRLSTSEARCQREATANGLCSQHAHLRADHVKIKTRILMIPARD